MRKRTSHTMMERAIEAVPAFNHVLRKLDEQVALPLLVDSMSAAGV